jgi:hypothetical protein
MPRLYVLGGRQKEFTFRRENEWNLYESAVILEVDTESGFDRTCVEYQTPREARADENSSSLFKSGTLVGDTLYVCTNTEVLVYRVPSFELLSYVSLPCFNDLHHVMPAQDGRTLLAVSTGLDLVVRFTPQGELVEAWDVLQERPWSRFSREVDYRKVSSTKPHRSHPNFLFTLGADLWVTRFEQRDAICLADPAKRIDIGVESPHDGVVCGEHVYFTVVDGQLVKANASSLRREAVIDLKSTHDPSTLSGWCRGVLPVADEKFWVGFTRVRKTRWDRNVLWLRGKEGLIAGPTHIALYDIARGWCVERVDLEQRGLNVVFSIFLVP